MLAILYDEQGDTAQAIRTRGESKQFCTQHGMKFDGQDLLDDFRQGTQGTERSARSAEARVNKRLQKCLDRRDKA